MKILKFGGSSVANAENIKKVIEILQDKSSDSSIITIVSALGGVTDKLIECSNMAASANEQYKEVIKEIETRHLQLVRDLILVTHQSSVLSFVKTQCNEIEDILNGIFLLQELSPRTKDRIVSYGELLSSRIIAAAVNNQRNPVQWIDARNLIITDSNYGNAAILFEITNQNIQKFIADNPSAIYLVPGFVAASIDGIQTTLGRGGSDYTAAIFAAALNVEELEIWTDVSGMMTADPRIVKTANVIPEISYQEAMELSHFGAKVIYPPTIQPVMNKGINVRIKNTFKPKDPGTLIKKATQDSGDSMITGISSINQIALISLEGSGMVGIPGFSKRLFEALANKKINVILITQSSSEHSISVGINQADAALAKNAIDEAFQFEINTKNVEPLSVESDLSIVALVGDRMKNHTGISGKLFGALGKNGINVRAIAQGSSERNISTVVNSKDVQKAINVIHEAFFETDCKEVNLFLAGVGNVGSKLINQIKQQQQYLLEKLRLKINIVGVANSKKYIVEDKGIDVNNWMSLLENGVVGSSADYMESLKEKNFRNMVFADVTANEAVALNYASLLEKSIAIVACNKIACSSSYSYYKELKDLATEYNAQFLFETNVGASLPIIGTLNDLLRSGDRIHSMQAVLSGTLNFVFNQYDGQKSFASVVKQAQDEGYTEPDPRLDLGGKDVMRKIMILARESGQEMEMNDIENDSFMPAECMEGTVADFYACMEKHEAHFKKIYDKANAAGCKLKFVATYKNGNAKVGLQHIHPEHDFYHLYGKDNIVLFQTDRYVDQPLVVKGAGAGADVTASGIFADIIRASKS